MFHIMYLNKCFYSKSVPTVKDLSSCRNINKHCVLKQASLLVMAYLWIHFSILIIMAYYCIWSKVHLFTLLLFKSKYENCSCCRKHASNAAAMLGTILPPLADLDRWSWGLRWVTNRACCVILTRLVHSEHLICYIDTHTNNRFEHLKKHKTMLWHPAGTP